MDHVTLQGTLSSLAFAELGSKHRIFLPKHLIVSLQIGDHAVMLSEDFLTRLRMSLFNVIVRQKGFLAIMVRLCVMIGNGTGWSSRIVVYARVCCRRRSRV